MQPLAVMAMALATGADRPDGWSEGLRPEVRKKKDNDSTPVAFDVNDGNSGKVEVNGECKGDGNSNGPVDNNDDNDYNIGNNDNDNNGGGQDRSTRMGCLWRSRGDGGR